MNKRRKRLVAAEDLKRQKGRAKIASDGAVYCSKIIIIGKPVLGEPIEQKVPKRYLDQALDNAIVKGDFQKVKKLVEQDGAIPLDKHLETAEYMKEGEIASYLKAEIEKRRSENRISIPPEDGWDGL